MTGRLVKMPRILALAGLLAAALPAPVRAEDSGGEAELPEHDRARHLLEQGEIRPLDEILASLSATHPGEVVSTELHREAGRWVYELKIVTADGRRIEIEVDAATMAIMPRESD